MDERPETRPCTVCGELIEPGASYVIRADGPVHVRHSSSVDPPTVVVDLYPVARPDTFPGDP